MPRTLSLLAWRRAGTGDCVHVSKKRRLLLVTVQKGLIWPEDEALLPKLDINRLSPVGEIVSHHIGSMLDDFEDVSVEAVLEPMRRHLLQRSSGRLPTPEDPTEAAVHMPRQIIRSLFSNAWLKVGHCLKLLPPLKGSCA